MVKLSVTVRNLRMGIATLPRHMSTIDR